MTQRTTTESHPTARVSVVVPTYNRSGYIAECLASLLAQTTPAHEILVVDDGSEDDTPAVVRTFGNSIRYIRKDNGGKASAVNVALSIATGTLIWILDDDDVALPQAIECRLAALAAEPDAGFVYTPHYLGVDGPNGRIKKSSLHESPTYPRESFFFELMKGCFFHLGSALVWRSLYQRAGPFDETLRASEDYDMQLRLSRIAAPAYCREPTFIFRQHVGTRGDRTARYKAAQRSAVFRTYDRVVGKKLISTLALHEFLPDTISLPLGLDKARNALLARMTVMASKGCIPEMLADIESVIAMQQPDKPLSTADTHTIASAACTGYVYPAFHDSWHTEQVRLHRVAESEPGRQAIAALSFGFLRRAASFRESYLDRIRLLGLSFRLLALATWHRLKTAISSNK